MKPTFDIDALRMIVAGAELGSFARAAVQLGRSQSAISMQLKRLEEQAGRPLFQRNGRGLVPTEAGDALLAYARRIIELHDEAAVTLGSTAAAASIRIGLPQDFFDDVMPDAITRFSRQRPGVHVEVRAGRNYALEDEVEAGQLDMALVFFRPGRNRPGKLLASLPLFWFAGRSFAGSAAKRPAVMPGAAAGAADPSAGPNATIVVPVNATQLGLRAPELVEMQRGDVEGFAAMFYAYREGLANGDEDLPADELFEEVGPCGLSDLLE